MKHSGWLGWGGNFVVVIAIETLILQSTITDLHILIFKHAKTEAKYALKSFLKSFSL